MEEDRIMKEQEVVTKNTWARLASYAFMPHNFQTVFVLLFFNSLGLSGPWYWSRWSRDRLG